MNVRELIDELSKYPGNLNVILGSELDFWDVARVVGPLGSDPETCDYAERSILLDGGEPV